MGREQANKILLEAAAFGNEMALRKALEDGAEIEAQDERGWSALSLAAWKGHASCVKKLIKEGAALEPKGGGRAPALHWAARRGREKIVGMLLEAGAAGLILAVRAGHARVARELLEAGADAEARDRRGWDAIEWARAGAKEGKRGCAEALAALEREAVGKASPEGRKGKAGRRL